MRHFLSTTLALAALGVGVAPAPAGAGDGTKCNMELSACVREMASYGASRGWIGIEFESPENPTITRVVAGGPAEEAGVRTGDVWVGLDDFRFADLELEEAMQRVKKTLQPGTRVVFHLKRDGRPMALEIEASRVPRHILAQWVGQHVLEGHLDETAAAAPGPSAEAPGEGGEG